MADELRYGPSGPIAGSDSGTTPGQLWFFDGTLWRATTHAPADGQVPEWSASENDWTFTTAGSGAMDYFDLIADTVALWNFNDTLADQSGNGFDLQIQAGTYSFADVVPGLRGLRYADSARLGVPTTGTKLLILGPLTIELIQARDSIPDAASQSVFVTHGAGGVDTDPANNTCYQLALPAGDAPPSSLSYFAEQGAGVNVSFNSGTTAGSPSLGPVHEIEYIAMTRGADGQIQFYYNGRPFGARSTGLLLPTGGGNGVLTFAAAGSGSVSPGRSIVLGMRITARELTASEIKSSYNRTVGPGYGILS